MRRILTAILSAAMAAIPQTATSALQSYSGNGILTATDSDSIPSDSTVTAVKRAMTTGEPYHPLMTLEDLTVLPSPEAHAMSRHMDEDIDRSTGTGTLSIPLYSWESGDIGMSLGLRYRIVAYKVRERAGWVGLGWNLTGEDA